MGTQFGFMARLTWWEYSWDVMEPVTYFVGYATAIAMFAYYVITRQVRAFCYSLLQMLFAHLNKESCHDVKIYRSVYGMCFHIDNLGTEESGRCNGTDAVR